MKKILFSGVAALALAACGGASPSPAAGGDPCGGDPCGGDPCGGDPCAGASAADEGVGPLKVGAGYESWTKLNTEKWKSKTHGGRMVEVYVNDVGLEAYKNDETDIPVGSVIVKTSFEADGADGPVFVMEKREDGFAPDTENWYYAMYWPVVPPKWQKRLGNAVYWESPSNKVDYCWKCHENYDRELGGIPAEVATWQQ